MKKLEKSLKNPNRKSTHPGVILRDEVTPNSHVGLVNKYFGDMRTQLPENGIFNVIVAALDNFEPKIQLTREDLTQ